MVVKYTVSNYLHDNLKMYIDTKYYIENYYTIFVRRAKKLYPAIYGFIYKKTKTDHMYYVEYINDEMMLGDDQFGFLLDLDYARKFYRTYKRLLDYGNIKISDNNIKNALDFEDNVNNKFINSEIDLDDNDLKNIFVAKLFLQKYF